MKTFKIFNDIQITFGLMDRIRILFGKEVKVSLTLSVNKEVEVFDKMTESSIYVEPFIKPKTIQMQEPEILNTDNSLPAEGEVKYGTEK